MGYGTDVATTVEELEEEYALTENNSGLSAGDTCQESDDCDEELFRLDHPRNPQTDALRHSDGPEHELVCIHHGVVASW